MQRPQEARPRARSPFVAAFLSLLFPGLGHVYAGAYPRALAFAAAPILAIALVAGIVLRMDQTELIGLALNPGIWTSVFVVNLLLLVYRVVAIVDAYRVADFLNRHDAGGDGRYGPARLIRNPLSVAGLFAVILVMAGVHVVVARVDMIALDTLTGGCIFIGEDVDTECADEPDPSASPAATPSTGPTSSAAGTATPEPSDTGTPPPDVSIPPWDGKERLNILLIGADTQEGGHNTDSLITISIDPVTKEVAMFSLPRDMTDVPVPSGPARNFWGSVYGQKINSFFVENRNRSSLWPGKANVRGYNALKAIIGELYGLDVRYFVEVDFAGFRKVIDAVGGVTVNVQTPVVDNHFPAPDGQKRRLYIGTGLQHMTGSQALQFARVRKVAGESDFTRAARQQRILLSLREQTDPYALIPKIPELVSALKTAVKTDIPVDQLDELLGLAAAVDTANIRSYVFSPPLYGSETAPGASVYKMFPNVSRIRAAVKNAFKGNPQDEAEREQLAQEAAQIWVLSGLSDRSVGPALAGYLEYRGLAASSPRPKPAGAIPATTKIVVYNGAEADLQDTIAYLEKTFKVKVTTVTDPAIRVDIVVTIGRDTPELEAPPLS
jgi:LCP family protein required for cell wall assembly